MNECQDWDDWAKALQSYYCACARCQKTFNKQLIYRYAARYYVGPLDGVPQIVEFDYQVCSNCLFDLISRKYTGKDQNGEK